MRAKHKAISADEMKAEILHFMKIRAEQERGKMHTTASKISKSFYLTRAMMIEALISELESMK